MRHTRVWFQLFRAHRVSMMTTLAEGYMITTTNLYIHQKKNRPFPNLSFFEPNLLQIIDNKYYLYIIQLLSDHHVFTHFTLKETALI